MPRLTRILFVCHGNICRSPMAEYVFKYLLARHDIGDAFLIDSAATSTEELGNPVHSGTRRVLEDNGIPCGEHRARQISKREAHDWDVIVVMDSANVRNARRILGADAPIHKLLEFAGSNRDVADPWYTGDFETTFNDVMDGCEGLLGWLGY